MRPLRRDILDIEVSRRRGGIVLLACVGEIDTASAPRLVDCVRDALRNDCRRLCVDLAAVEHLDSAGIAALVNVRRYVIRSDGTMSLVCPEGHTLRVLALAGLDRHFRIEASRERALAALAAS